MRTRHPDAVLVHSAGTPVCGSREAHGMAYLVTDIVHGAPRLTGSSIEQ
jgi:hypothetical protein